ncbi:hypothetical protein niasHS_009733 [Heterodera schachtii]|uniref:Uncharacterized protein n=1 Tax=Heterodera schachtii TaxID=97005 RepID=A0ABD2J291_HETSC
MWLDLQNSEGANVSERHGVEQTVLEMNKELTLKWRSSTVSCRRQWRNMFEEKPTLTRANSIQLIGALSPNHQAAMVDSGLGRTATEGQTTKVPLELKRPIAFSFLRRPTCASELSSMAQLHHRLGRQKPKIGQKHSVDSPKSLSELSIYEEMLRFACENLLTFHSLLSFPSVSSDFPRPSVVPFSSHTSNIPKMPIKSQKMEEPAVCSAQRRIAWHWPRDKRSRQKQYATKTESEKSKRLEERKETLAQAEGLNWKWHF